MTTPSTSRKAGPLLGTGAQTTWPFTFKVFAATDIAVTIADSLGVETALVYNVDYSVTLNANQETSPGGAVTYPISGSPMPVGRRLVIIGNLPYDQPLDLPSGGNFSPLALENQLDRTVMQVQQLRENVGRALQLPVTAAGTLSVQLPPPTANQLIGWDAGGSNLQNVPLADIATALAFATYRYDTFTGDGTETQFTLSADPATLGNLDIAVGGVTQTPGTDYTLLSGVLVFSSAPPLGATILARYGEGLPPGAIGNAVDVVYTPAGAGAVVRTVETKLRETVSVKDFGAVGDGATDDTAAIQAAFAYAYSISIGTITNPYANMNAGKVTVYFPAGKYIVSGKISTYDGIAIVGSGRISTIIQSSYNGNVIELQPATSYNAYGIEFSDFQVVGDRTKSSQVGIALMRPYNMYMQNVGVTACGSDGILARQALICEWHNIESWKNVGAGIRFTDGTDTWDIATANNWPSNANRVVNAHCVFNDGPGIVHSSVGTGGVNGNVYDGGACEYNYHSSAEGTGYNIEILDRPYMPSEFVDMWCEGPVKAHVHVNMAAFGTVRFTRFKHFGGGAAGYPERAIINDVGVVYLDSPYGTATQYRDVTGPGGTSKAPFRVNKAGGAAVYAISDAAGSTVTGNLFVEDENQYTTGLQNQVPYMNNFGNFYTGNGPTFTVGFGFNYPAIKQEGQAHPQVNFRSWDATNGTASGWAFGSGSAAPDTLLLRKSANVLGMGNNDFFDAGSAWNNSHLVMGAYRLWVDATGSLRIKNGAPTSDTDGAVVGTQT